MWKYSIGDPSVILCTTARAAHNHLLSMGIITLEEYNDALASRLQMRMDFHDHIRSEMTRNSSIGDYAGRSRKEGMNMHSASIPDRPTYWKYKLIYILAAIGGIVGTIIQHILDK